MLTGDKIETAMCVGRAIGLIRGKTAKIFVIEGVSSPDQLKEKMQLFYNYVQINNVR
jgi:magnesium-transporting ATPase (P-type)